MKKKKTHTIENYEEFHFKLFFSSLKIALDVCVPERHGSNARLCWSLAAVLSGHANFSSSAFQKPLSVYIIIMDFFFFFGWRTPYCVDFEATILYFCFCQENINFVVAKFTEKTRKESARVWQFTRRQQQTTTDEVTTHFHFGHNAFYNIFIHFLSSGVFVVCLARR
jgi:hypothetical protein